MAASIPALARPRVLLLAAVAFATALAVAKAANAYHTQFIATYCNYAPPIGMSIYTRNKALTYAEDGAQEGYQWGGGDLLKYPSQCY